MSRSKKKNPFAGHTTATSDKLFKKIWNRCFRHKANILLETPVQMHHSSGDRAGNKDGKFRFDPLESPKLLRK